MTLTAHSAPKDTRLELLGLRENLIKRLKSKEGIHTIPDLAKILRITPGGVAVEVGPESSLGYLSGREICRALADHGIPMINCGGGEVDR